MAGPSGITPGLFDSGAVPAGAVPGEGFRDVRVPRFARDECVLRRFPLANRFSLAESLRPFVFTRRKATQKRDAGPLPRRGCSAIIAAVRT